MNRFFIKGLVDVLQKIRLGTAAEKEINDLWAYCEKSFGYKIDVKNEKALTVSESIKNV